MIIPATSVKPSRRWRPVAALLLVAVIGASCSSDDGQTTTASTAPAPTSTVEAAVDAPVAIEPPAPTPTPAPASTPAPTTEVAVAEAIAAESGCIVAVGNASVTCSDDGIVIESNGLPTHQTMVGIENGGWNGQWPSAQDYTGSNAFFVPTDVVLTSTPALTVRNTAGVTANGIPFFFPHAPGRAGGEDCLDLPVQDGECQRDPVAAGEMDICGGHVGRGDDYHYHEAPTCVLSELPEGAIVGYMLDGIPMFESPLDGSVPYEGCSGWISPDGLLHYAFEATYPYLTSCMLGEFSEGPSTQGSDVDTGDIDTRTVGAITSFVEQDGCQTMTFSSGAELVHCD